MPYSNQPDFVQILELWWGGAYEADAYAAFQAAAGNVIVGTNPPYTLSDFLGWYAKFFGPATASTLTTTALSTAATLTLPPTSQIAATAGQFLTCPNIPPGTTLVSIGSDGAVVLSNPATADGDDAAANVYGAPWVPILVIQMFITLATSHLQQRRWLVTWPFAMALFIAHYMTLFMQTETQSPNLTAAEVVTSGLQQGVIISQSAGDVSATVQPIAGFDAWGTLNQTEYGAQLATLGQTFGAGIMYIL